MMAQLIDRRQLKAQMKEMLRCAQVSPRGMTCLYLALTLVLNLADSFLSALGTGLMGTFVSILTGLMGMVLTCGYVLYCMAIRRGERAEYLTLFDGFSFVGKVILLNIVISLFTFLWGMLAMVPYFVVLTVGALMQSYVIIMLSTLLALAGMVVEIMVTYRYRLATYFLLDDPDMTALAAIRESKGTMAGRKGALFVVDLSFLGWGLLSLFTFGIVGLWAIPYMWATEVNFYHWARWGAFPNDGAQPGGYQSPYQNI